MIQLSLSVSIPPLVRLGAREKRDICRAAGNSVAERVRAHFRTLPGEHFWKEAADATRVETGGRDIEVWVEKRGVALQRYGGVVTPGKSISSATGAPTRLLSLPTDKSITERPGRYAPLVFIPIRRGRLRGLLLPGKPGIARRSGKKHKKGEPLVRPQDGAAPLFRLVDQTTHSPHPNVLPSMEELHTAAARQAARYIELMT